jgi:VWFA-related protein
MRTILRCGVAAATFAIVGCASSTPPPPSAVRPSEQISAPLNLCAPADSPPKAVAALAGYVQYAVTVTDGNGNPVSDLKQSDFVAYVGNQSLPIKYFREDKGGLPHSIVVVIDESGSMINKLVVQDPGALQSVRRQIADATKNLNQCDELAVIAVAGHAYGDPNDRDAGIRVIQPLTTDHALALSRIPEQIPYGQTPLYDGISKGLELIESSHYPNHAMIVVTDGLDNKSDLHLDEVLNRAKRDDVAIYAIGIGDPNLASEGPAVAVGPFVVSGGEDADRLDADNLKALSVPSGGQYFIAGELAKDEGTSFVAAVGEVAETLEHGYSIGVITPSWAGQTVPIGLANPGSLRVNARMESTLGGTSQ